MQRAEDLGMTLKWRQYTHVDMRDFAVRGGRVSHVIVPSAAGMMIDGTAAHPLSVGNDRLARIGAL